MIELVARVTVALLVVLALMWGLARMARRPLTRRGGAVLGLLARQQLSRGSSVAVLQVLDRALVLGVTDSQITLLGETDLAAVEQRQADTGRRDPVEVDPSTGAAAGTIPGTVPGAGAPPGRLAGSALSPRTWARALEFLRDRTARK